MIEFTIDGQALSPFQMCTQLLYNMGKKIAKIKYLQKKK